VRLVVTPERMVIDEARRAHTELALFEVACDAVVVNRMLPDGALAEPFFSDWGRVQSERLAEIESWFSPLPVFRAPLQDDEVVGLERLAAHGRALFGDTAPDAVLSRAGARALRARARRLLGSRTDAGRRRVAARRRGDRRRPRDLDARAPSSAVAAAPLRIARAARGACRRRHAARALRARAARGEAG
jgi:hypothetical protein